MCGIFGVANHKEASYLTYLGLHALQHRGEEACGIASTNGQVTLRQVANGLVDECFRKDHLMQLPGNLAIGHVRYSTSGGSLERNAQPLMVFNTPLGELAIAHNGNIPGYQSLRSQMQKKGALFYTDSDTEVLLVAIVQQLQKKLQSTRAVSASTLAKALADALRPIEGAYSLLLLSRDFLIAVRDPWGVRPLAIGKLENSWVFSSETNAFDFVGATFLREVKPGEIVIAANGSKDLKSFFIVDQAQKVNPAACIFEMVYFARPDSNIFGRDVYQARRAMGRVLAQEAPVANADCVIAVPDSANVQALGYAEELGLPCEMGLVRSHYIGRTFIAPYQANRDFAAKLKYNPVRSLLEGKRIVVVDDSIVRGTTSKKLIRILRQLGGAKEVHFRVASPPMRWPCFYGIDMPTRKEFVATDKNIGEIKDFLDVDSLGYLSLEGMLKAAGASGGGFCTACFSGNYPIAQKTVEKLLKSKD